jgi:uncharacterized membrane protein
MIGCPAIVDGYYGEATATSRDGKVVVGHCRHPPDTQRAFRWTAEGGHVLLGEQASSSDPPSRALDVSGDGSVVAGWFYLPESAVDAGNTEDAGDAGNVRIAHVWTLANGFRTDIPLSSVVAVSADGTVFAGAAPPDAPGFSHYGHWSADRGLQTLVVISLAVGVRDMSDDGRVVLGVRTDPRYTSSLRWLPPDPEPKYIPCPSRGCAPLKTNADGSVVVGESWVWDSAHAWRDFESFGLAYGWSFGTNWFPSAVSGDGKVFVGRTPSGGGFMLTLPESPARTAEAGTGPTWDASTATPAACP